MSLLVLVRMGGMRVQGSSLVCLVLDASPDVVALWCCFICEIVTDWRFLAGAKKWSLASNPRGVNGAKGFGIRSG